VVFLKNHSYKILPLFFLSYALFCLLFEISFIGTGIDTADEGWHLSKFMFPEAVTASVLRDHLYSSILFKWVDYDIQSLRALNLLFLVCSSFILSRGLYSWCTQNKFVLSPSPWVLQAVLFASTLLWQLPTSYLERVPAYNNLSSFLILSCIGLAMCNAYSKNRNSRTWIIVGILSALALIIRPPSGLALQLFLVIFLILQSSFQELKSISLKISVGFALAFICHFLFIETVSDFISTSMGGMAFEEALINQHGLHTVERYFWELFVNVKFALGYNKFNLLCLSALSLLLPRYLLAIIFLGIIATTINFYLIGDLNGGSALGMYIWRYYFSLASVIYICILMAWLGNKNYYKLNLLPDKRSLGLISLYMVSPILFAAGTHTPIISNMNFYTSFFWVGMLLFLITVFKDYLVNRITTVTTFLFCLTLASSHSLIHGRNYEPFYSIDLHSAITAKELTAHSTVGRSQLRIGTENDRLLKFLTKIFDNETVSNLHYCINFTAPAYNYHIGVPHPVQPWTAFSKNNFTLENIDQDSFKRSAIIWNSPNALLLEQLGSHFPDWQTTHKLAGTVDWYYHEDKISLLIYLPNMTNE
jgi:hypothetical protein